LVANRKQHIASNHAKPVTRVWEHESTPRSRNYIHMYKIKKRVNLWGFKLSRSGTEITMLRDVTPRSEAGKHQNLGSKEAAVNFSRSVNVVTSCLCVQVCTRGKRSNSLQLCNVYTSWRRVTSFLPCPL